MSQGPGWEGPGQDTGLELEQGQRQGTMQIKQQGADYGGWGGALRRACGLTGRQGDSGWAASKQTGGHGPCPFWN